MCAMQMNEKPIGINIRTARDKLEPHCDKTQPKNQAGKAKERDPLVLHYEE